MASVVSYCTLRHICRVWNIPKTTVIRTFGVSTSMKNHLSSPSSVYVGHQDQDDERTKWRDEAILYVHWPYCAKKCTYCNFNKYVVERIDHVRMADCLVRETETLLTLSGVKRIKSVFFGGGTPSLCEPSTIQKVLECVGRSSILVSDAEITLEANPTSTEWAKLGEFKTAGINRVSLGVQSLVNDDLRVLGRQHTVAEALRCVSYCKDLYPGRTSVDVIFGRPGQKLDDWQHELDQVLDICDDHLSVYQLTLEQGTTLFKQVMDRQLVLPGVDAVADMYELLVQRSTEKGFHRYEVSNFARHPASESVHNKGYWTSMQYIGVGPGAHGRFMVGGERQARIQTPVPDQWMRRVETTGDGTLRVTTQTTHDMLQEVLLMGIRTSAGVSNQVWSVFTDSSLKDVFNDTRIIRVLQDEGYLILDKSGLRATEKGLNVADALIRELINVLDVSVAASR